MESSNHPVDLTQLEESTFGEAEVMVELIQLYLQQMGDELDLLSRAVDSSSAGEIQRLSHKCRGSSSSFGANHLAELLNRLEEMGKIQQMSESPRILEEIKQEFVRVENFLFKRLEELRK